VHDLFKKFIDVEFAYLFSYEYDGHRLQTGNAFIAKFVSQLYCRVFISNQSIVNRGDYFSELYMIFKGKVVLSCTVKDDNEYFQLYTGNFFGDYQVLLNLKASECYKASSSVASTYCHCIKKKALLSLLDNHQEAYVIFMDRAFGRRAEFRRIKKVYEKFARVNPDPFQDQKQLLDKKKFTVKQFSDFSKEEDQPSYLVDPEFYFGKAASLIVIPDRVCEEISESEMTVQ